MKHPCPGPGSQWDFGGTGGVVVSLIGFMVDLEDGSGCFQNSTSSNNNNLALFIGPLPLFPPDLCPPNMIYQTAEECRGTGGACPRLCLDQAAQVECASTCYEGCYCPEGLFLQNNSCVPQTECSCYHKGALYQPGENVTLDACNNW